MCTCTFLFVESCKRLVESAETLSSSLSLVQITYQKMIVGLLTLAGDIHLMFSHNGARGMEKDRLDFNKNVYRDSTIANKAYKILVEDVHNLGNGLPAYYRNFSGRAL